MGNDLIVLDRKARRELEQLLTDGNTAQKIAKRARIVLMTADGDGVVAIMREVGVSKTTVWRWQDYFAEARVDGRIKGRSRSLTIPTSSRRSRTSPVFTSVRRRRRWCF